MDASDPTSPWVLAIETSNPSSAGEGSGAGVAGALLGSDGAPGEIVERALGSGGRHDDGLMPAVEAVRAELGARAGALSRVCVSIGPGGYTGLRVAAATAMLLGESAGAAVVGVPSASVAAASVEERPVGVALASKRGTAHLTRFSDVGAPFRGEVLGVRDESGLDQLDVGILLADGFLPDTFRHRAEFLGIFIRTLRLSPSACLRIGMELDPVESAGLRPVYAREPEAVRLWRRRPLG